MELLEEQKVSRVGASDRRERSCVHQAERSGKPSAADGGGGVFPPPQPKRSEQQAKRASHTASVLWCCWFASLEEDEKYMRATN